MHTYPWRRFFFFNFFLLIAFSFGHFTLFACRSRDYISNVSWPDHNQVATRSQELLLTAVVSPQRHNTVLNFNHVYLNGCSEQNTYFFFTPLGKELIKTWFKKWYSHLTKDGKGKCIRENRLEGTKTMHSVEQKRNVYRKTDTCKLSFFLNWQKFDQD